MLADSKEIVLCVVSIEVNVHEFKWREELRRHAKVRFSTQSVLIVTSIVAFFLWQTIVPRIRESRNITLFGNGEVGRSAVNRSSPGAIDRAIGFGGHVDSIEFVGDDDAFSSQLIAGFKFNAVREISFYCVEIDAELPEKFRFQQVKKVSFSFCDGAFVQNILSRTPNVESIETFNCNHLYDRHMQAAGELSRLTKLSIDGSAITGSFAEAMIDRSHLVSLEIRYSPISMSGVQYFARLKSLNRLVLEFPTSNIRRETFNRIFVRSKNLNELVVTGFE